MLGWAYKKNTNDSRESASIYISSDLLEKGAVLNIYDPMVKKERIMMDLKMVLEKRNIKNKQVNKLLDNVHYTNRLNESFLNTKGIIIMTEWDEFKEINWNKILTNEKKYPLVFDGRNIIQNKSNHKLYTIGE